MQNIVLKTVSLLDIGHPERSRRAQEKELHFVYRNLMLEDSIYSLFIPLVLKVNLTTKGGFEEGDLGAVVRLCGFQLTLRLF